MNWWNYVKLIVVVRFLDTVQYLNKLLICVFWNNRLTRKPTRPKEVENYASARSPNQEPPVTLTLTLWPRSWSFRAIAPRITCANLQQKYRVYKLGNGRTNDRLWPVEHSMRLDWQRHKHCVCIIKDWIQKEARLFQLQLCILVSCWLPYQTWLHRLHESLKYDQSLWLSAINGWLLRKNLHKKHINLVLFKFLTDLHRRLWTIWLEEVEGICPFDGV